MIRTRSLGRLAFILLFLALAGCPSKDSSLSRILNRGEITVITDNSAHGYYIYREESMGFEYDLAKAFADYIGVELNVITPGWNAMFTALKSDKGDFIASSLTRTENREARVDFSREYMAVQQQVVVRKGSSGIDEMADINGRTIHIRSHTSYHERLRALKERGISLAIKLHENIPTEEFLRQVQDREIDLTVADSNIIQLNRRYYPDIYPAFPISEKQSLGWAVKTGDRALLEKINAFFDHIKETGTYAKIYNRYYAGTEIFDYVDIKKFHRRLKTRLPKYQDTIVNVSKKYNFDWRLIAAQIYQESHFDPQAQSYSGALGLMQLTGVTANEMGVSDRLDPGANIRGGIKYLHVLYQRFDKIPPPERIKFALASYNVGYGHVRDAQKIAQKQNLPPTSWKTMETVLPLLRYPKYYQQTRYGYARGTEPVRYIKRIYKYYDILRMTDGVGDTRFTGIAGPDADDKEL
ncbi:MAG: membrane-bound lytic murein transglycosylase MltF [Desulfobacterales bacterium]|nr:membrane-bound lytic murein transglycosylase MltF [Desulfobacterales bacterium]